MLIESELKEIANINENYLITPIDPPTSEIKSEPTRSIICIIGALIGFIVGLILFSSQYFKKDKVKLL